MSEYQMPPPSEEVSNYPRAGVGDEFYRPPGVHFEAISDAWTLLGRDRWNWLAVVLGACAVAGAIASPFVFISMMIDNTSQYLAIDPSRVNWGGFMISILIRVLGNTLAYPIYGGILWVALSQIRGRGVQIGELFAGFRRFFDYIVLGLIMGFVITIGFALFIIPGLYLAGALSLAPFLVLDKGMKPVEACKVSMSTLGSNAWAMIGLMIVLGLVASVGMVLCCVGIVFTLPISYIGNALIYHYYFPERQYASTNVTY